MARTAAQRTLAGFTLGELLARQVYGEVYRATGDGRRDARLLIVAPQLASDTRFGDALARGTAPLLGAFHHRAVVGTVVVARDGRDLVIVTDGVAQPRVLDDVLARAAGRGLPPRIAATIARSVIDALATAHALGITHGALHPRSILVDGEGVVRVTDFAVGFAAMAAAAAGSDAVPLRGLGGYLAPELALGDEPGPTTDVYAIGALLFALLSGATPPGTLHTTPAMERLVQRALDTDLHRRFANAIELQENFAEAIEDDRWELAQPGEVAHALAELASGRGAAAGAPSSGVVDGSLDDATEDLLASLSGRTEAAIETAPSIAPRAARDTGGLGALLDDLEESTDAGALTTVDSGPRGQTARDPISELIALAPEPPTPEPPRPNAGRRAPALAAPDPTGETVAPEPPPPAPAAEETPRRRAVALVEPPAAIEPPKLGRSWSWLWGLLVVAAGAALAWGISRQGDELSAGEKAAAAERQKKEDAAKAIEAQLRDLKAKAGTVRITSEPDQAVVWLLLGRTPMESIALGTNNIWELRLELEGHQPVDTRVGGNTWSGSKDDQRASITVPLAATAQPKALPVQPPEPPPGERGGIADGRGRLKVETTPAGAQVWLFVGTTNTMALGGIEAGRDYEFRVVRDGHAPAYVRIAADEWRDGGDPAVPLAAAPKKKELERNVVLTPAPRPGKRTER